MHGPNYTSEIFMKEQLLFVLQDYYYILILEHLYGLQVCSVKQNIQKSTT